MNKVFAVAMVFKRPLNATQTEEHLRLHIIRDAESKGEALINAFDKDKDTRFQDGGMYSKVVLEVPSAPVLINDDHKKAINELSSALYFNDSSDFRSAINTALSSLVGEPVEALTSERIKEIFDSTKDGQ